MSGPEVCLRGGYGVCRMGGLAFVEGTCGLTLGGGIERDPEPAMVRRQRLGGVYRVRLDGECRERRRHSFWMRGEGQVRGRRNRRGGRIRRRFRGTGVGSEIE